MKRRVQFYLILLILISLFLIAASLFFYIGTDIPSAHALKHLENRPASNIYGADDGLVYLLVPDNKVFVPYNKFPGYVKDAFLAAEDADFFKHGAVDPQGILRALSKNIMYGKVVQGGSTITQQVVKSMVLGPERSMLRKVREAILAYRLEHDLTKQEILNLYLNNIYMGQGIYGTEAAAQVYFGKHIWEVSRAEAALLAGIVQAPSRYTPKKHPGSARVRQEYVIDQMYAKHFIDERRKREMLKERINIREDDGLFADSYFKDYVLKYVEDKYGKGILSRKKLNIYATVDRGLQRTAEESVKRGLDLYEQRKGDYAVLYRLERRKWEDFKASQERDLSLSGLKAGKVYNVLISEKLKDGYTVFTGKSKASLKMAEFPYKPGDVVRALYLGADKKKLLSFQPARTMNVEGALISMDVNTGYVSAMVGGRDFQKSPYNRAISAKVQSGSAFKPFIYLAALQKGYGPDSVILDEPKEYPMGGGRTWTPRNYDGKYEGRITVRDAIAYSKNAATVRLLEEVGVAQVKEVLAAMGINADVENNLSIALGTSNMTVLELLKGYATFANGGFRVKPLMIRRITDDQGNTLEENGTEKERAIPEEIASKMNLLLKGPVEYGTAKGATKIGFPIAGKTGTTSNYYDALFVGYSPHVATAVWVGFDARTSLGKGESGARICLPVWMNFMASALRRYPPDDFSPPQSPAPHPTYPDQQGQ